jgi:hypothetical protein
MTDPAKTEVELPEMPEPIGEIVGTRLHPADTTEFWGYFTADYFAVNKQRVYTADQMRAYATAAVLQERERCAKICEARAAEHEENGEDEGDDRFLVYAKHERRCAAVIRAQKEPT